MSAALENRRVLVLNSGWKAIATESLKDALGNLFPQEVMIRENGKVISVLEEPKARIVCPESFQLYTWDDWSKLRPEEGEPFIQGFSDVFKIPEVMITRYSKFPQNRIRFSRRTIYRRDGFTCQYCGCKPGSEELTIDHVLPKSKGGLTEWTNCALACVSCNAKKANRTPEEAGMKLLSVPHKPRFSVFRGDKTSVPKSWKSFLDEAYWSVELQN